MSAYLASNLRLSGSETKILQWLAKYCKIVQIEPEIIQNEHPRNDQDHADGYHHPRYQVHHLLRHQALSLRWDL